MKWVPGGSGGACARGSVIVGGEMQTDANKTKKIERCWKMQKGGKNAQSKNDAKQTEDGCCTLTAHIVCQNSLHFACRLCSKPASADNERIRLLVFERGGTESGWLPEAAANFNRVLQDRFWFPSGWVEVRSISLLFNFCTSMGRISLESIDCATARELEHVPV